jgi:hypothetical protein
MVGIIAINTNIEDTKNIITGEGRNLIQLIRKINKFK